jgi:hypothetical protein
MDLGLYQGLISFRRQSSPFASSIAAMIFIQYRVQLASFGIDSFFSSAVQCALAIYERGSGYYPHLFPYIAVSHCFYPILPYQQRQQSQQLTPGLYHPGSIPSQVKVAHELQIQSPLLSSTPCFP